MIIFIRCILLSCLLSTLPASAKILLFSENLPGFQYYNQQGEFVGSNLEKVHLAFSNAELDYELNVMAWPLSYNGVLRDSNACIFSIARLPLREKHFQWVARLSGFSSYFYALPEKNIKIASLEQAKNYKTAVVESNFSHHFLSQKGFELGSQLIVIENVDKLFQLMTFRKELLDFIVLNEKQYLAKRQLDSATPILDPIFKLEESATSLYLACNKNMDVERVNKLRNAFQSLGKTAAN